MEKIDGLRPDEMTSAERMEALLKGQPVDRVPLIFFSGMGFCARNLGYSLTAMYDDPEKSFHAQILTMENYSFEIEPILGYASYGAWEFGGDVRLPRSEWEQAPKIVRFPIETYEDAWNLKLPDIATAGLLPKIMEFSRILERNNLPITLTSGSPFTRAGNMCGVENLCRWMIKKPEIVHHILRLATDHIIETVHYWINIFGAENLSLREGMPTDSNQVISPKQFEEFALPYQRELHEKVFALGIKRFGHCHICGDQNDNLPYIAQIPMGDHTLLSFGHEVDLTTAIKYLGDTCIIAGNINTSVIQTGTPEQVYELSRQCIEKGKYAPCGYGLMAGCEIPAMAPPENVYMMRKAINDFGWYN
ncbi:uroporphyrinogen decarboxylase family protein [Chloroflexota bacterium]